MKKAFVTGTSGFVGANLVRFLLQDGYEVHGLIRSTSSNTWRLPTDEKLHLHDVDITDAESIKRIISEIQPEYVFHLAQYGGYRGQDDEDIIKKVCVDGTKAVLEACKDVNSIKAIVHTGSSSEYGIKDTPMNEEMVLEPHTEYGEAKAVATLYGQQIAREFDLPVITLRLFAVYGPFEAKGRLVPNAILACMNNEKMNLSDPDATRDFIYIEDVVSAIMTAAKNPMPSEIFNIGTGSQKTIKEMVDEISKAANVELDLDIGGISGRNSDVPFWQADITKAKEKLNWSPQNTFEQGVKKTVKWFYDNEQLYKN